MSTPIVYLIPIVALISPLLWSCDRDKPGTQVDPQVGRECFEQHRLSLPPGTQYEGFEASGDRITIKVMTGAELARVDCLLSPDGTLGSKSGTRE